MALIDDNLNNYLKSLTPNLDGSIGKLQKLAYDENVPIISNDIVKFLSVLLSIKKTQNILEIGCAVGFSASFMSSFLENGGTVTTIERYNIMIEKAKKNIKNLGLNDKIKLIEGDARDVIKTLQSNSYDVVFMDAGKGQYINILQDVYRVLKVGGIIIADDILQNGNIALEKNEIIRRQRTIHCRLKEFLWEITHNEALNTCILPIGDGVSISIKTKEIGGFTNYERQES